MDEFNPKENNFNNFYSLTFYPTKIRKSNTRVGSLVTEKMKTYV